MLLRKDLLVEYQSYMVFSAALASVVLSNFSTPQVRIQDPIKRTSIKISKTCPREPNIIPNENTKWVKGSKGTYAIASGRTIPSALPSLSGIDQWLGGAGPQDWDELKGKIVVIYAYKAFCCSYAKGASVLKEQLEKYSNEDVYAIGIMWDETQPAQLSEYQNARALFNISWSTAYDPQKSVVSLLLPEGSPDFPFFILNRAQSNVQPVYGFADLPRKLKAAIDSGE